jgi:hypothetical protein
MIQQIVSMESNLKPTKIQTLQNERQRMILDFMEEYENAEEEEKEKLLEVFERSQVTFINYCN